jgi:hypothetical protein
MLFFKANASVSALAQLDDLFEAAIAKHWL